jgi:hypothetical protein
MGQSSAKPKDPTNKSSSNNTEKQKAALNKQKVALNKEMEKTYKERNNVLEKHKKIEEAFNKFKKPVSPQDNAVLLNELNQMMAANVPETSTANKSISNNNSFIAEMEEAMQKETNQKKHSKNQTMKNMLAELNELEGGHRNRKTNKRKHNRTYKHFRL